MVATPPATVSSSSGRLGKRSNESGVTPPSVPAYNPPPTAASAAENANTASRVVGEVEPERGAGRGALAQGEQPVAEPAPAHGDDAEMGDGEGNGGQHEEAAVRELAGEREDGAGRSAASRGRRS